MNANPAIELRAITKRFGAIVANDGLDLKVQRGTIHGLIGENGAGKSTAMKIVYGMLRPDAGELLINGQRRAWTSPAQAIAQGIGMVHQHFMLAEPHTALDNIVLGSEPGSWGFVNRRAARAQLQSLASQHGLVVDWDRPVEQLPVGVQQRVEILKLLYRQAEILILDEPTAVLTPQEIAALFVHLKRLREAGKSIILATHKLKEVLACTDRVTVLRAGKIAAEMETSRTNPQELANLMVGRKVSLTLSVAPAQPSTGAALSVQGLQLRRQRHPGHVPDIAFQVRHGEIVGIAGVEGNGQSELLSALLHPVESASAPAIITVLGEDVTHWPAARIRALGVALIPEDRQRDGLVMGWPVAYNYLLGGHRGAPFSKSGWLDWSSARAEAARALRTYDVRPPDLDAPAGALSGGNQQKLILAREFERQPRLLIASQPTRGIDVGAIEFIHKQIVRARDGGAGVLLISSELEEVLALSDRILVMYERRLVAEFRRGEATERELGLKMGGA